MTKIEKMKKSLERTKLGKDRRFCMDYLEGRELLDAIHSSPSQLEIISLVFDYGKAKGYRAAKAEMSAAV